VIDDLKKFWPASTELALAAIAISGPRRQSPLGVVSAAMVRPPGRTGSSRPPRWFLGSMPVFWLGLMGLVFVFYRQLDLLPAGADASPSG